MTRRGGILLETLLAITLFVVAALAVLQATSRRIGPLSVLRSCSVRSTSRPPAWPNRDRTPRHRRPAVARHLPVRSSAPSTTAGEERLRQASTERSPHAGLTLVELTVLDSEDPSTDGGARAVFVLRKLVRLRDGVVDAYESDDLLEGLPDSGDSGFGGGS